MTKIRLLSLIILSGLVITAQKCDPCKIITCQPGYHCDDGKCVQDQVTCDQFTCPQGSHCEIVNNAPTCVQDPSCEGYNCQTGFHCEMKDGKPTCVKDPIIDPCQGVTCLPGTHCEKGNCVPDNPPPDENPCPKDPDPTAVVYMNNKAYGQGWDSTVRVKGDAEFCRLIHGEPLTDCHLEGWPKRAECEYYLLGNNCPIWEYTDGTNIYLCHDDQSALASCDHFGNPVYRDDPKTPTTGNTLETLKGFEGEPKVCGLHRDAFGPYEGFFTVAHGKAQLRACTQNRDPKTCGPWKAFDH